MTRIRLPHIQAFTDRHGHIRYYFRRAGFRRVTLPGAPGSAEFMKAYEAAMAVEPARIDIGASRTMPGTIKALVASYLNSNAFRSLSPASQRRYRSIIEKLRIAHGDKRVAMLERRHVVTMLDSSPLGSVRLLRAVLSVLMKHSVDIGLRENDPTRDVRLAKSKSEGFHSWTDAEIAQFESCHPASSRARLALALLLFTGQRRSDVVKMGRQHVSGGCIHVRQQKTGVDLQIPLHPDLAALLPAHAMTFLLTRTGKPFTPDGFGEWFRKCCNDAGLPHCSAHGLRKASARRLAEAGCSALEIAAITGHATLAEVQRYTRAADQRRLAVSAIDSLVRTGTEQTPVNPTPRVDKSGA